MARIRIIYEKKEWITFVNHMDLPLMFSRAARRAGLKQEFTQGFSPHPHISLGPPLAIGVEGLLEPAEFWFTDWNDGNCALWNEKMPQGIKILKCAEVEGPALAKSATAAVYTFRGIGIELEGPAKEALEKGASQNGILYDSALESGAVTAVVGDLEHCSAGKLVRAMQDAGVIGGWRDLDIVRTEVGTWDPDTRTVLPLI